MRYFLKVIYDGTAFHGSQLQGDTPTVQLALNDALSTLLRRPVVTFGASRTDQGVHALGNFYHFDEDTVLTAQFTYKLNAILPQSLAIKQLYRATNLEANARFDALSRRYRYRIYRKKNPFTFQRALFYPFQLERNTLDQTAEVLKQYNDFETFSKRNTQSFTFLCTIRESYWEEVGEELHYVVEANRFLRGMVRGLVGTQLQIARNKRTVGDFQRIIEAKDCTLADFSVSGNGLYLEQIQYPENYLEAIN